ncbi:MAG: type II toxin-antitoxin system RelE/ParE family toxin [Desulfomonile tiedjei]|uniref:Type II toxin-antitoxin system RelE/ParE family toxin n=1 Tax=Desulfomonile tiedjei TaxID=2358 RepID=A0A9D6UZN5_9BACT|nr:type II toxin-antitoxin system RelE/ParE family toxin [Desulfomonile tiedjei]
MIKSFKTKDTEKLFNRYWVRAFQHVEERARVKLEMIDAAEALEDLRKPPGNQLEALGGDRKGQHSIRINKQWRICFTWGDDNHAYEVEICDYH